MQEDDQPNIPIWKSHVWHEDQCFFVSTIERTYDTYEGQFRGEETLVWKYDWKKRERLNLIHQANGIRDHQAICRCLIEFGEIPDEEDERWKRFKR